jgi:hypothetical protein
LDRLRNVRHERSAFDGRFFERHRHFWPIARAAATFADRREWPDVHEYATAFAEDAPVRFETLPPRKRRMRMGTRSAVARDGLYDAVIVGRRVVPTRRAMWHDYLNAMVWATFPRAKLALHRRQHVAIERWLPEGATQLPNARTRELDALALIDEGGVLLLEDGGAHTAIHFGHALFEGLVLGQPAMIARAVVLDARGRGAELKGRGLEATRLADDLLSEALSDPARITSPDELPRLPLDI